MSELQDTLRAAVDRVEELEENAAEEMRQRDHYRAMWQDAEARVAELEREIKARDARCD